MPTMLMTATAALDRRAARGITLSSPRPPGNKLGPALDLESG